MIYRTLIQAVADHGASDPNKLAVACKDELLTYRELTHRMKAMAEELRDTYGIQRHDRVAISAVSRPDYVVALLAVQYLGATALLLDKTAKAAAILDICDAVESKLVLTDTRLDDAENRVPLKELYARSIEEDGGSISYELPAPEDIAEILLTTGTTGKPKGAILTHDSIQANMGNTWSGIGMLESDRVLLPLPLNHSFGMRVLRSALWGGAAVVLQNGFTFAKELESNIEKHKCTALAGVPASIETIQRQMGEKFPEIMGRLRYIEIGAGALPVDMRKRLLELLPDTQLHNTWGSTETGGALFLNLSERPDKITSAGRPLAGIDLKVVDSEGNTVVARNIDSAGRMALRGRMQMSGYYNMPDATADALVDGWLLTNDLIYTDEDGYVYMLGRADDIINVAGEKVSPIEVEQAAQEFAGVRECACIGVDDPDGITGKAPVLYVVSEPGFQKTELTQFLSGRLERYKLPKRYVMVQSLPKNRMQKLDRRNLSRMWRETGDMPLTNEVIRCLMERRSVRDFTEQPVPRGYLEVILQTAIHAPSGRNMQTWRFTVLREQDKIQELKRVIARTVEGRKIHFYGFNNPPVIILVSNDRRNHDGVQDSSCAAENMMLAAHSFGLGSVWINALSTICDEPEIRELLDSYEIPARHTVIAALAFGWPKEPGKLLAKKQDVVKWVENGDSGDRSGRPVGL